MSNLALNDRGPSSAQSAKTDDSRHESQALDLRENSFGRAGLERADAASSAPKSDRNRDAELHAADVLRRASLIPKSETVIAAPSVEIALSNSKNINEKAAEVGAQAHRDVLRELAPTIDVGTRQMIASKASELAKHHAVSELRNERVKRTASGGRRGRGGGEADAMADADALALAEANANLNANANANGLSNANNLTNANGNNNLNGDRNGSKRAVGPQSAAVLETAERERAREIEGADLRAEEFRKEQQEHRDHARRERQQQVRDKLRTFREKKTAEISRDRNESLTRHVDQLRERIRLKEARRRRQKELAEQYLTVKPSTERGPEVIAPGAIAEEELDPEAGDFDG